MPFTKISEDQYQSPSGRKFTKKQVVAYYATDGFKNPIKHKGSPVREHFQLATGRFLVPKIDNIKRKKNPRVPQGKIHQPAHYGKGFDKHDKKIYF